VLQKNHHFRTRGCVLAGLPEIVFGGSGDPLPPTFTIYPTRVAHGYIAALLVGLISLHVLAALYHQLVKKDGLFRRMLFGRRMSNAAASADQFRRSSDAHPSSVH
jgi:Prokaryotic cytochrome b561